MERKRESFKSQGLGRKQVHIQNTQNISLSQESKDDYELTRGRKGEWWETGGKQGAEVFRSPGRKKHGLKSNQGAFGTFGVDSGGQIEMILVC